MKTLLIMLTLTLTNMLSAQETTTVYLIRHAEKADATADTNLSETGKERADKWAAYFQDKGIAAIYSTPYNRAKQTAAPLAASLKKEIITYQPSAFDMREIASKYRGKAVLIVGHSNTIPGYVNKAIGENKYSDIDETEFGTLFEITFVSSIIKAKQSVIPFQINK